MHFGSSVVGTASTISTEISPTPPPIFTGGGVKKCENWHCLKHHWNFDPPAFENWTRYPKSETNFLCRNDHPCPLPAKFGELGFTYPWVTLGKSTPHSKIVWHNRGKSRVPTHPWKPLKVLEFFAPRFKALKVLENRTGAWKSLNSPSQTARYQQLRNTGVLPITRFANNCHVCFYKLQLFRNHRNRC